MKITIKKIDGRKDYDKELVWMKVDESCDAGHYTLADTTYTADGKVSSKVRHTYWMPDKNVKKGDWIKVFTKSGQQSEVKNNDGTTTHIFYWGLDKAVWNNDKDCAVLFEHNTWQFHAME